MPVLDGNFAAFVTNLGKYNEGELVGEWVKFPISAEEMQKVFEKSEETMWECRICGHLVVGRKAPEVCPVCKYSQSFFEVRKENY